MGFIEFLGRCIFYGVLFRVEIILIKICCSIGRERSMNSWVSLHQPFAFGMEDGLNNKSVTIIINNNLVVLAVSRRVLKVFNQLNDSGVMTKEKDLYGLISIIRIFRNKTEWKTGNIITQDEIHSFLTLGSIRPPS
uniref:Uncharacterized protein n=1 Tax=Cucumis melo TaxID=3656 RepID=A0A9I9EH79_CUCME